MAARRKFIKTINGKEISEYARTEADAVRLVYNGWREVVPAQSPAKPAAKKTR